MDAIDHLTIHSDSLQHNPQYLVMLADFFAAVDLKGDLVFYFHFVTRNLLSVILIVD